MEETELWNGANVRIMNINQSTDALDRKCLDNGFKFLIAV